MSGILPIMAEYPGATRAGVSPNRSKRTGKVRLFIVHHYASTQKPDDAWRRFNVSNDRSVSPNYQVNADGSVFEVVPPDNFRAWTTGPVDHQAVTCETQNTSGAPAWGISAASREAIAHLIVWASRRYGFPIQRGRVTGTPSNSIVEVPGIVGHRDTPAGRTTSTACPGPSMDVDGIIERARQIAEGGSSTPPAPVKRRRNRMFSGAWRVENGTIAVQSRPGGALTLIGDPNEWAGLHAGSGVEAAGISGGALEGLIGRYGVVPWPLYDTGADKIAIVASDAGDSSRYVAVGERIAPIPSVAALAGLQRAGFPVEVLPAAEVEARLAWLSV